MAFVVGRTEKCRSVADPTIFLRQLSYLQAERS